MARSSKTVGKKGSARTMQKVRSAKGRTPAKTKPPVRSAARLKSPTASDIELKEAREQQAATAEILKVMASSPSDVQPVFEAIVNSAAKLFAPCTATITTLNGGMLHWNASAALQPQFDIDRAKSVYPVPFDSHRAPSARAIQERRIVEIPDVTALDTPEYTRQVAAAGGFRSVVFVPLIHNGKGIGTIVLTHAQPGFRLSKRQLALLQTFADQAVIAIENARLFNETREALERQSATAEVLKVISRSAFDLEPVLDALLSSACRLCEADIGTVRYRAADGDFRLAATFGCLPEWKEHFSKYSARADRSSLFGRTIIEGRTIHLPDVLADPDFGRPEAQRLIGFRATLSIPLAREGQPFGVINFFRFEVGAFNDRQIELLQTFADQAVIAIKNVELFEEVQARTRELEESLEQQTATSEVLQVISSSPAELEPVFRIMLENATRVCGANFGMMQLWNGETFETAAAYNVPPAFAALREGKPIHVHHPQSGLSDVLKSQQVVHIHDITKGPAYLGDDPNVVELADIGGARTVVLVPMLKKDEFIGTFTIYRQEARPFTDKQIALVENFTKQAVIAIENTRLLRELRERTDALSHSLDELRSAQDRLVQTEKLASLGQLTAGIAHEIKNPLNFVNNFSALSAELLDEMTEVFENPALDEANRRKELDEIRELLKGNLEKVVQHGKRADSIVKNMLLHSREGSGELRAADINGLVEESLNLAYHGARAEKTGFNIILQREFDASAGSAELFPQEITRALLNLISNGFYAATKRKTENGETSFEPTLSATTRNLGTSVEIRIRDNGTGIPPDVKEKIFNPFFTTKPAGEGTGLGLSMTHDIIVKQHGGTISVDTEPGTFTEFIVTLPRATGVQGNQRSTK
jgi:two-component system NtrC family sensor kinase